MGGKLKLGETRVKCDEEGCKWERQLQLKDVPSWHNVRCPECGVGIIINDSDLEVWYHARFCSDLSDIVDPEKKHPRYKLHIDTSGERRKEKKGNG